MAIYLFILNHFSVGDAKYLILINACNAIDAINNNFTINVVFIQRDKNHCMFLLSLICKSVIVQGITIICKTIKSKIYACVFEKQILLPL